VRAWRLANDVRVFTRNYGRAAENCPEGNWALAGRIGKTIGDTRRLR